MVSEGYDASIALEKIVNAGQTEVHCAVRVERGNAVSQLNIIWPVKLLKLEAAPEDPNTTTP